MRCESLQETRDLQWNVLWGKVPLDKPWGLREAWCGASGSGRDLRGADGHPGRALDRSARLGSSGIDCQHPLSPVKPRRAAGHPGSAFPVSGWHGTLRGESTYHTRLPARLLPGLRVPRACGLRHPDQRQRRAEGPAEQRRAVALGPRDTPVSQPASGQSGFFQKPPKFRTTNMGFIDEAFAE